MKTPREILFASHQAAAPKLDVIRREVVRKLNREETTGQSWFAALVASFPGCFKNCWCELVFPCRRIWTGLATVWILLFIVNFSQRDPANSVTGQPVRSQAVTMSWQAQQRWMNNLLTDRSATPPEADRPKPVLPKPRTENHERMTA